MFGPDAFRVSWLEVLIVVVLVSSVIIGLWELACWIWRHVSFAWIA